MVSDQGNSEIAKIRLAAERLRLAQIVRSEVLRFVKLVKVKRPPSRGVLVRVAGKCLRVPVTTPVAELSIYQDPVLWRTIFLLFYEREPSGIDDPDWGRLFDRHGLDAYAVLRQPDHPE